MEVEKDVTIPPGIVRRLEEAKADFRLNMVILTLALLVMTLMVLLLGPTGWFRILCAEAVYWVMYLALAFKFYNEWQREKDILTSKRNTQAPSFSQPRIINSNTAPTSQIDIKEMEKLRSGECKTKIK